MKISLLRLFAMLVTLSVGLPAVSQAFEPDQAINNFTHDYVVCSVFYSIGAEGVRRTKGPAAAVGAQAAADRALLIAAQFSDAATVDARQKLSLKEQVAMISGDYANLAILNLQYGDTCASALSSPRDRLLYWLNKKR